MSDGIVIERGNPTAEEVAALTALFYSMAANGEDEPEKGAPSAWNSPGLRLRKRRNWRDAAIPARRGLER
ncbi:acyl-CoA carboxylase subunit epsilon [Salininema proteolyticum]|uniref:Acyl-CoA carboxylase subunit epsilon n=1 Tax=Salininema proteolyticum TaxID=1607685 RepID=A0ABV8TSZ0_9ACTN